MGLKFEFIRGPRACTPPYFNFYLFFIYRDVAFPFGRLAGAQQQQQIIFYSFFPLNSFLTESESIELLQRRKMECFCIVLPSLPLTDAKQPHTQTHKHTHNRLVRESLEAILKLQRGLFLLYSYCHRNCQHFCTEPVSAVPCFSPFL